MVSRRPPDSNPIIASPARSGSPPPLPAGPSPSVPRVRIRTGTPGAIIRAASARVLAGTRSVLRPGARTGFQPSSRMASRYRSVATSVIVSPSISRFTPVITGSVSSRLAAGVTWPMAVANTLPSTVPASRGSSGSRG